MNRQQKEEDSEFIRKEGKDLFERMILIINKNLADPDFSTEQLAADMGLSSRHLYRKLKEVTDYTPAKLIREYRLMKVEKLLVTCRHSVDEIMYKAGFNNRGSFYRLFSQKHGMTPKEYRKSSFFKKASCLFLLLTFSLSSIAQVAFEAYFEAKTLRFDFILSGNNQSQQASLLKLSEEPIWGGPTNNLIEPFDYGEYAIKLYDKKENKLIYCRGFNSLYQEWRTTPEAKKASEAYTNTAVMPYPKNATVLTLECRRRDNMEFEPIFQMDVDPKSIFINRSPKDDNQITKVQYKGDPSQKVDLVFIAEGYTEAEQDKFLNDVRRLSDSLFSYAPYDKHQDDFNLWAVHLNSKDSETDYPGWGNWRNTALNSGFWTFDSERYLTIADILPVRNAVWNTPCDAIIVLVNSSKYGGGGMFNFYAVSTVDHPLSARVMAHEFGHSFGGLGDEYFNSSTSYDDAFYPLHLEPWEPNITTLVHFDSKWKDLLPDGTPIPTPVDASNPDKIGVFEGGGYQATGIYRPQDRCMMRDNSLLCPVCQRTIERMINFLCGR